MKNNLKIIIWIFVVLIIGVLFYTYYKDNKEPTVVENNPPVVTSELKNFTASNGSFSFDYDSAFTATPGNNISSTDWELNAKQKGLILASVNAPKDYMPQTNFSEAKFTIGKSSDVNAVKSCLVDNSGMNAKGESVTVSGYPFTKFVFSDAGAGNFYETTSYKGLVGGDCYAVEYTIHSTNIGNYPPERGIKEFDKTKIVNDLESIVQSFRLIVASN